MLSAPRLIVIRSAVDYDLVRVMKIIFNKTFHDSTYADNVAAHLTEHPDHISKS